MNFADLNAAVSDLRHACDTQIDPKALVEVGVRGPAGTADEAAFLRLTAWCYVLLYEAGRTSIPFLLQLSLPGSDANRGEAHRTTRSLVQALRTWLFHSLTSNKDHDLAISKAVSQWFLTACRETSPHTIDQWESSFQRLCTDVFLLIRHCTTTISAIAAASEDREMLLSDLRRRLSREWPAHKFDAMIEDSASRLGETINAKAFRERRIADWRLFLAVLADDADIESEMERLIDGEVATHFRAILPISTRELMDSLDLQPGPRVKEAIDALRKVYESGLRGHHEIIAAVRKELQLDQGSGT